MLSGDRKFVLESTLVFAGFLLVYLLTLTHNLAASSDGIFYLWLMDKGEWLFHPHHLFNEPFCILWLRFWKFAGISSDSAFIVASLNSFFGAAGLGIIYFIQRHSFRMSIARSLIPTSLIGFSFGYWFYSDSIKTNIIPVFLTISILAVLLKYQLSRRDIIVLAILNGLAIIFHEVFILTAFSSFLFLVITRKKLPSGRIYCLGMYAAITMIFVIAAYGIVIVLHEHLRSFTDVMLWTSRDARTMKGIWNSPGIETLQKASVGFLHSIVGIYFCFKLSFFQNLLLHVPGRHDITSGMFLVRDLSSPIAIILFCTDLFAGLFCISIILFSFNHLRDIFTLERELLLPPVIFLLAFSLFFLFCDPSNMEFWIIQSVMFWLIFGRVAETSGIPRVLRRCYPILPVLIFIVNYFGNMYFLRSEENDYYYVHAKAISGIANPEDIIISDESAQQRAYYRRYSKRSLVEPDDLGSPMLDSVAGAMQQEIREGLTSNKKLCISFNPLQPDVDNSAQTMFYPVWKVSSDGIPVIIDSTVIQGSKFFIIRGK